MPLASSDAVGAARRAIERPQPDQRGGTLPVIMARGGGRRMADE